MRSGVDMVVARVIFSINDRGLPDRSTPSSFNLLVQNEQRHLTSRHSLGQNSQYKVADFMEGLLTARDFCFIVKDK